MWSTVEVNASSAEIPEGDNYTLVCTVSFGDIDLQAKPKIVWLGPDGSPVQNGSNTTVKSLETVNDETRLALYFLPLNSSHGGEYSCRASVDVPYLNIALSKVVNSFLDVTSKSVATHQHGTACFPIHH